MLIANLKNKQFKTEITKKSKKKTLLKQKIYNFPLKIRKQKIFHFIFLLFGSQRYNLHGKQLSAWVNFIKAKRT